VLLARDFYARTATEVARDCLGKILVHGSVAGRIVEVEAYLGVNDRAAHSWRGPTNRTRVTFGPPGHAYVYLSYGMHECLNIVAEAPGTAGCVLIRALEPVAGLDIMRLRRKGARSDRDLASGPGKLTQALGITRAHYGADLTKGDLVVSKPRKNEAIEIDVSPRIGITKAAELPLRFTIRGNSFVSR